MLKALGEKGGVAGINFYPVFVSAQGRAMTEDLVRHLRHIVNVAGIEAAAIGTDFDGFDGSMPEIDRAGKMPALYDALRKAGFTESQIEKICFQNALRVIKDVMVTVQR